MNSDWKNNKQAFVYQMEGDYDDAWTSWRSLLRDLNTETMVHYQCTQFICGLSCIDKDK